MIIKKHLSLPLKYITQIKLQEKSMRNKSYHSIIVVTVQQEHTLKGIYINEMIQFFQKLQKAVKDFQNS